MLWILWTLLSLVVILVLAFVAMWRVGRRLPIDHVCSAEVDIDQPIEAVWDVIANVAEYPAWSRISRVERLKEQDGPEVWRQHFGRNSVVTRTTVSTRPTAYQQTIDDDHKYFSGTWSYELRERPSAGGAGGCIVRLTEHGRIHPAIPRFFMHYLVDPAMYLKGQLRSLGGKFGSPGAIRVIARPRHGQTGAAPAR
jgi:Polyketide cyclase / dehydrase and lipid transport